MRKKEEYSDTGARMREDAAMREKYCACKETSEVRKDRSLRCERVARDEAARCVGASLRLTSDAN